MPRLLRTRVLVLCSVALLVLSGCFGSTPWGMAIFVSSRLL
jgi:hypothetical protein